MKSRVERIFSFLSQPVDAILIRNTVSPIIDENFFYATGLHTGLFESSLALLQPDGSIDLIISELEAESAKQTTATIHVYTTKKDFDQMVTNICGKVLKLGFNASMLPFTEYVKLQKLLPQIEFIDVTNVLRFARGVKDAAEIESIKKACSITDKVMLKIPEILAADMHEFSLAAEINYLMQRYGADKPGFDTISSFGANTAEPHYSHGDTQLNPNSYVLCDHGACFHRYNSDATRTFIFGKASDKQKRMHQIVRDAQQTAFTLIRPGIKACDVHCAVYNYIESTEFSGCFIHSTGHSLGLQVHDGFSIGLDDQTILQENMVLTIEPGVYIPGYGGVRIEDDVLITKQGYSLLTQAPRELIEI